MLATGSDLRELNKLLDEANADPGQAPRIMRQARDIAQRMGRAEPYPGSRLYLPGLMLPATTIIEVPGIGTVAGPSTSQTFSIDIRTPGVVVGLLGVTLPNADSIEKAALGFQLTLENKWKFASTGDNAQDAFASYGTFGVLTPWMPVLLPVRGTGGWSVQFQNTSSSGIQPIFNLAFLEGKEALRSCGFETELPAR